MGVQGGGVSDSDEDVDIAAVRREGVILARINTFTSV